MSARQLSEDEATPFLSVAKALPSRPHLADALAAGAIGVQHARGIATSTAKVDAEVAEVPEKELVTAAERVDLTRLGVFARELRARLGADESAAAAEQRRYDERWLETASTYEGMLSISGMLDPASAAVITRALGALTRKSGEDDGRTMRQRRRMRRPRSASGLSPAALTGAIRCNPAALHGHPGP